MTVDSAALLKMLEPAVRPVPTSQTGSGQLPIEQRSFESLLSEVQQDIDGTSQSPVVPQVDADAVVAKIEPLKSLQHFGAIENTSLRGIIGRQ